MNTRTYQVIDTANGDEVVAEFSTHRRALNHTHKLEPQPTRPGKYTKDWRYLIRPVNTPAAQVADPDPRDDIHDRTVEG